MRVIPSLSTIALLVAVTPPVMSQSTEDCVTGEIAHVVRGQVEHERDDGEFAPAPNVIVTLTAVNADTVGRTITDKNGMYYFSNVRCGQYRLTLRSVRGARTYSIRIGRKPFVDVPRIRHVATE